MSKHIESIYQKGIVAETEHRMYAHLTGYEPVLSPAEQKAALNLEEFIDARLPKERNGIPADSGFRLVAKLGDDPEPEIRGETTFGLNPKWIDWYCRTNHTAVWKARKAGKEKLRKLQMLVNRYNK